MLTRQIAENLAFKLKQANPDHHVSQNVQRYAIEFFLTNTITFFMSVFIGFLLNQVTGVIIALVSFASLRVITGGKHFKTHALCNFTTIVVSNLIPFISIYLDQTLTILFMNIFAIIFCVVFAPEGVKKYSRMPAKMYPMVKVISVLIISLNFYFMSPILAITFALQGMTLVHKFWEVQSIDE